MFRASVAIAFAIVFGFFGTARSACADDETLLVAADVNGSSVGDVRAVVDGPRLVDLDARDLARDGIPIPPAAIDPSTDRISPQRLGPRTTVTYDDDAMLAHFTVVNTKTQTIDVSAPSALRSDVRHPSAYANYDLLEVSGNTGRLGIDAGATVGTTQLVATGAIGDSYAQPQVFAEHDLPDRRTALFAGRFQSASTAGDSGSNLEGVSYRRDFGLDPARPSFPLPAFSGVATQPATADIYVNGSLRESVPIAPGPYALQGIAGASDANVRVVLRNADGSARSFDETLVAQPSLLAMGSSDYSYSAGRDVDRGDFALTAARRVGVTDRLTLGLVSRAQTGRDLVRLSSDVAIGRATLAHLAVEDLAGHPGVEGSVQLASRSDTVQATYSARSAEPLAFAATTIGGGQDRQISLAVQHDFDRSTSVRFEASQFASGDAPSRGFVAEIDRSLPGGRYVSLGVQRVTSAFAKSTTTFALRFSAATVRRNGRSETETLSAGADGVRAGYASYPAGELGTRSAVDVGAGSVQASVGYANSSTNTQLGVYRSAGSRQQISFETSGGFAAIDRSVRPARELGDGFVLVEVPGFANLPVHADGRYVGRTDASGDLLVGGLLPYTPATVTIDSSTLPLDVSLASDSVTVVPSRRGGSVARFGARVERFARGRIVDRTRSLVSGTVRFFRDAHRVAVALDDFATFQSDELEPGRWSFVANDRCAGVVDVPPLTTLLVDLGNVPCTERSVSQH